MLTLVQYLTLPVDSCVAFNNLDTARQLCIHMHMHVYVFAHQRHVTIVISCIIATIIEG